LLKHITDAKGGLVLRSDANNAYQLCLDVAQAITEEPRRYNQSQWVVSRDELGRAESDIYQ